RETGKHVSFSSFAVDFDQINLGQAKFSQNLIQRSDLALHGFRWFDIRSPPPFGAKRAEINRFIRKLDLASRGSKPVIENRDVCQIADIFFENCERRGMRFETDNPRVWKPMMKIQNRSANV